MGKLAKTTTIVIGEQPHTLLLDMNAMVAFEEQTKENFFDYVRRVAAAGKGYRASLKELRAMVWCELLHENNPDFDTPEKVGALISLKELGSLETATREAAVKASPEPQEGDNPNPQSDQTG